MKETTKLARPCMQNVKVDWINSLPDELLIHVLSFLTTKEAMQTCILSKRWASVWANLPILKFNINEFGVDDSTGDDTDEALRKSFARFDHFVNGVVVNLKSTHLNRVCYVHDTKPAYFYNVPMQWLHQVALLMPQLINISIAKVKSVELPDSLFSCVTLQHLKIKLIHVKKTPVIPESINLPSLKVFDIGGAGVELHDNFLQNLLTGCPSLVTLNFSYCDLYFSSISSNMLSALDIRACRLCESMQISCPSLFSLRIFTYFNGGADISLKNMKSLKNANIGLGGQHFGGDVPVLNFLGGFTNATKLSFYLYSRALKVQLERDSLNCRNLNNLEELIICMGSMSFDFNLVASLLKHSPKVKKLSLVLDVEHTQEDLGDVLYQHKYIETVKIRDLGLRKLPQVFIKTLMKNLNTCIKEIGNIITH